MKSVLSAMILLAPEWAQGPPGGRGGAPPRAAQTPRASAAVDLTGTWISVVTEDWKFRMVTPPKGEFGGVPLNGAGRTAINAWDPAKDEAAGNQCKAYGAAALMRVPGRLRIAWENDNTLKIETEAGVQTRRYHFGSPAFSGEPDWQGFSVAQWEAAATDPGKPRACDLKVVTTHMKAGYLRKNGVPYSENAVLTEYWDRHNVPGGDTWIVVTTEVTDPQYLTQPFITSTHFKKIPDNSVWRPEACSAK